MTMTSQFTDMTTSSNFFKGDVFLLSSLVTGPNFMSISYWFWSYDNFLNKGFTGSWEIGNIPVWVCPVSGELGELGVRDTKFGTNVSNQKLWNAAKCQGYSFYRFKLLRENRQWVKLPHTRTHTHTHTHTSGLNNYLSYD